MGIRGLGFKKIEDNKNDYHIFLNKIKEDLFKLGAFGFENWNCEIKSMKKETTNSSDSLFVIHFSDTPEEKIAILKSDLFVGDHRFPNILKTLGFSKISIPYIIKGYIAQLGDFKVRYGPVYLNNNKIIGILFDLEYLPIIDLINDSDLILNSFFKLLKIDINLIFPQKNDQINKFDLTKLGECYLKLFEISDFKIN